LGGFATRRDFLVLNRINVKRLLKGKKSWPKKPHYIIQNQV